MNEIHCKTRDGRNARIICVDRKCSEPVVALIQGEGREHLLSYPLNGRFDGYSESNSDLMLQESGWINLYAYAKVRDGDALTPEFVSVVWETKEEALRKIPRGSHFTYLDTIEIKYGKITLGKDSSGVDREG